MEYNEPTNAPLQAFHIDNTLIVLLQDEIFSIANALKLSIFTDPPADFALKMQRHMNQSPAKDDIIEIGRYSGVGVASFRSALKDRILQNPVKNIASGEALVILRYLQLHFKNRHSAMLYRKVRLSSPKDRIL